MRSRHKSLSLGSVNLALLSCYFFPVWGRDAVRALISPFNGLENPAHATAALYFRRLFDIGFNNLTVTSHIIAGIKLVMVAAFVAYLIEFARSWATGRATDRETTDVVLILAVVGIVMSALPALAVGEAALIRLTATQMLMVAGAITVIVVERHIAPEPKASRVMTAANRTRGLGARTAGRRAGGGTAAGTGGRGARADSGGAPAPGAGSLLRSL